MNLIAKEKAKELVDMYYNLLQPNTDLENAKQCAFLLADEISDFLYKEDLGYMYYWEEVKREIFKEVKGL